MIRILAVDDEKPIVELLKFTLNRAGYQCIGVYDGLQAANLIERDTFDLILLDIMLPGIDGFALMDYIRDTGIPVIFLTAKNAVADRVKGLRMGAEDYIVKPFDVLELLVKNPDKVYSREKLLGLVWGSQYPGDVRTVDVHIRRLREKIEVNPSEPKYVHTKWGVGYYFKG